MACKDFIEEAEAYSEEVPMNQGLEMYGWLADKSNLTSEQLNGTIADCGTEEFIFTPLTKYGIIRIGIYDVDGGYSDRAMLQLAEKDVPVELPETIGRWTDITWDSSQCSTLNWEPQEYVKDFVGKSARYASKRFMAGSLNPPCTTQLPPIPRFNTPYGFSAFRASERKSVQRF